MAIFDKNFRVTEFLPSKECTKVDAATAGESLDFVRNQYIQEELREKEAFPEDLPPERAIALGLVSTENNDEEAVSAAIAGEESRAAATAATDNNNQEGVCSVSNADTTVLNEVQEKKKGYMSISNMFFH
jgi:hypothetical protein